jgi:hypothetical protein
MPSTDTMIARIALSLWTSARKVERLPRVLEVHPWEHAEIVPFPPLGSAWRSFVGQINASPSNMATSFEGI